MKAFKGTVQTKREAVADAKRHRKLDMLIKGTYGKNSGKEFKGCSVGCAYTPFKKDYPALSLHQVSEPVHGIPVQLTHLRDRFFERLDNESALNWHVDFTMAINVGADLSGVMDKFMLYIVTDVQKYAKGKTLVSIQAVAKLYKRRIKGDNPTIQEWREARSAAAAAADAADAAAAAAAADAAAAAAADAAAAAAAAADADADAAAAAYAAADADAAAAYAAAYAAYAAAAAYAAYAADADAYAAAAAYAAYAADADADAAAYAAYAAYAAARVKTFKKYAAKLLQIIKEA